ncbi:hypothetical protein EDB84DRAFT_1443989 [Lactarius hengduanensis]|nr:hypothetical protein EDB84DRAFT_1443989 [Lactarius hengduanensis]
MPPPSSASDDDDDCLSVQLDSSEMSPKAPKVSFTFCFNKGTESMQTILRQRFAMRQYHLGQDGRLTNLARAMDADAIMHSIGAILQPHTSSPSVLIIARAMANLMAATFSGNDLDQVLNAHLDSLAISPQVKQAIFPALLGIAKFTEVHAQNVTQPQVVIGPLGPNSGAAAPNGAHTSYQVHQRPFGSSSGSGYTIWCFSKSSSSIQSPPIVPQAKTGHLYVHFATSTKAYQYWMLGVGGQWESVSKNAQYPLNPDRVLSFRNNGEPSWVTRATTNTSETRRENTAAYSNTYDCRT